MIFGLLYDVAIHLYAASFLPRILFREKKYPLKERLGRDFPKIEKKGRQLIWIHAVSLGETKAVAPLIKKLKALPTDPLVLLTTATKTGHEEGKKTEADYATYLPLDFRYIISPLMKRLKPDLVIVTETDFWYHFQRAAKKNGARLVVVNGKLSERSFARYKRFPFLSRHLLDSIDHFYLQGALYADRFKQLGISREKLAVTGNIKLDAPLDAMPSPDLNLKDHFVITLGSTHAPEEEIWITALKELWMQRPEIKVFLVPRHPERFNEVEHLLEKNTIPFVRWTQGVSFERARVVLVDEMGVLKTCYQLSDVAFVGGSFTPRVGGHNILEPALYGKPVLFGPYMHSQPDLLELVKTYRAGIQITPEEIIPTLLGKSLRPYGERGLELLAASRGALDKTFQGLLEKMRAW